MVRSTFVPASRISAQRRRQAITVAAPACSATGPDSRSSIAGRSGGLSGRRRLGGDGQARPGRPRGARGAGRDLPDLRAQECRESAARKDSTCMPRWPTRSTAESRPRPSSDGRRCERRRARFSPSRAARSTPSSIRPAAGRPPRAPRSSRAPTGPISGRCGRGRERPGLLPHLAPLSLARGVDRRSAQGHLAADAALPPGVSRKCGRSQVRSSRERLRTGWRGSRIGVDEDQSARSTGPRSGRSCHPVHEPLLRSGAFTLTETRRGTSRYRPRRRRSRVGPRRRILPVGRGRPGPRRPGLPPDPGAPISRARRSSGCTELSRLPEIKHG